MAFLLAFSKDGKSFGGGSKGKPEFPLSLDLIFNFIWGFFFFLGLGGGGGGLFGSIMSLKKELKSSNYP